MILHLSRQPRLSFGDVSPRTLTQAGMSEALGVAQSALTKVLRRLIDGGALLEIRTHVSGEPRRLKVYQLTSHGEAIARDLRRRGVGRSSAGPGSSTDPETNLASALARPHPTLDPSAPVASSGPAET